MDSLTKSLTAAAGIAQILQFALADAPPGRPRWWRRPSRDRREQAYLAFQRAVFDMTSWAMYLPAVALLASNRVTDLLYTPALLRELSSTRATLTEFLGALAEIRLVGSPSPRKAAEEITAMVAELYALPMVRPTLQQRIGTSLASRPRAAAVLRRLPELASKVESIREQEEAWRRKSQVFNDYQQALGIAHRDFTLAARRDVGGDRPLRRHWWQRWRPTTDRLRDWPGGWPGPDAQELIEQTRERRALPP
jgi:hypothetical protein